MYIVPTSAQDTVARDYLRNVYYQTTPGYHAEPEEIDEFCAELRPQEVIARINRLHEDGWQGFCREFADEIAEANEAERQQWQAEAEKAARLHLFPSRLPTAALRSGACTLTATQSVHGLGGRIADWRRDRMTWSWITEVLDVPVSVAMAWAIEGRLRRALDRVSGGKEDATTR
ncbi:hypothetical protein [Nocardia carnea]|uniref:hypothetical protein n=1 Tax=Nocardia carnea TaxID=37328 RepID=UPI002455209A|nr:hypothetical protein [Nocardia carnea]